MWKLYQLISNVLFRSQHLSIEMAYNPKEAGLVLGKIVREKKINTVIWPSILLLLSQRYKAQNVVLLTLFSEWKSILESSELSHAQMMQTITYSIAVQKLVWKNFHIYIGVRARNIPCFLVVIKLSKTLQSDFFLLSPSSHFPLSHFSLSYFSKLLIMIVGKIQFSQPQPYW